MPTLGPRVRVFLAASLDGFIAGPGHDLSWLPDLRGEDFEGLDVLTYDRFIADVGALLMGRATYDVVRGFDVPWPYAERPVLVASHRPLDDDAPSRVRRVEGPIEAMVAAAKDAAAGRDVYLDGGALIGQACGAGLVDELVVTLAPVALGSGHPLFGGLAAAYRLEVTDVRPHPGGMVQLRLAPAGRGVTGPMGG
jgi:dihydrofolate reductase